MFKNLKKEFEDIKLQEHYGKVNKIVGTTIEYPILSFSNN